MLLQTGRILVYLRPVVTYCNSIASLSIRLDVQSVIEDIRNMCWKFQAFKIMQWLLLLQLSDNWSYAKVKGMPNYHSNLIPQYFCLARVQSHHDFYDYYFYRQTRDIDARKPSAFRLFVLSTSIGKEKSLLGVNVNLRPHSVRILKCLSVRERQRHLAKMRNCHGLQQHDQKRSCFWQSLAKLANKLIFSLENGIPEPKYKGLILVMNFKNFRLQLTHNYTKTEKPMKVHNKQYSNFHSEISPLESIFFIGVIDRQNPNKYFNGKISDNLPSFFEYNFGRFSLWNHSNRKNSSLRLINTYVFEDFVLRKLSTANNEQKIANQMQNRQVYDHHDHFGKKCSTDNYRTKRKTILQKQLTLFFRSVQMLLLRVVQCIQSHGRSDYKKYLVIGNRRDEIEPDSTKMINDPVDVHLRKNFSINNTTTRVVNSSTQLAQTFNDLRKESAIYIASNKNRRNLTNLLNILKPFQPASNLSTVTNFGDLPIKKISKMLDDEKKSELMVAQRSLLHESKNKMADLTDQLPGANEKVKPFCEFEGKSFPLACHPFTFLFDSQDYRKNVRCSEKSFPGKYTTNSANLRYKNDHFAEIGSTNNSLFFQGFFPIENDTKKWSSKNPKITFENTMFLPQVEKKTRKVSNRSPDLTVLLPVSHETEDTYYQGSRITSDNSYARGIKGNAKERHSLKDELTDANVIITSKAKNESRSTEINRRSSRRWKKSAITSAELAHNDIPDINLFTGYSRPAHVKEYNNANTVLSPAYDFTKSENLYDHSLAHFLYKLFKNNSLLIDELHNNRSNTEFQGNRAGENFEANVDEELLVPAKMDSSRLLNFKDKLRGENEPDEFEHMYESIESTVGDIDYSTSGYSVTKAFNEFEYIDDSIDVDVNPDQSDDNFKEIGAST